MVKTLGDYIVLLLSIVGSLASIFSFAFVFGPSLETQGAIGGIFLGFLTMFFFYYNAYLISRFRKMVVYSEIFEDINLGFSAIHGIERSGPFDSKEKEIEVIIQGLRTLCNALSEAYSKVYGHHIGVCIKFLSKKGSRSIAETLVRDSKSAHKGRLSGKHDTTVHWLESNSDFEFIYRNLKSPDIDKRFFHEPNLPIRRDYRNSRLAEWDPPKAGIFTNALRRKSWPLPYRSTFVVPIVPLDANEQVRNSLDGFLCVDSPREGVFFPSVDVHTLRGISDGIYNKIHRLHVLIRDLKNGKR